MRRSRWLSSVARSACTTGSLRWLSALARPWPGMCLSTGSTPPSARPSAIARGNAPRPSPAYRHRRGRRSPGRRRCTGTSASGRQSTLMPSGSRSDGDQPGAQSGRGEAQRRIAVVELPHRPRPADRPASAAGRAAAPGPPSWSTRTGASAPTSCKASATRPVTWALSSMLRLNRIRPHGRASRRKARSSAVRVGPDSPVMNARARHRRGLTCAAPRGSRQAAQSISWLAQRNRRRPTSGSSKAAPPPRGCRTDRPWRGRRRPCCRGRRAGRCAAGRRARWNSSTDAAVRRSASASLFCDDTCTWKRPPADARGCRGRGSRLPRRRRRRAGGAMSRTAAGGGGAELRPRG